MKSTFFPIFENGFLTNDELDKLSYSRFIINNYKDDIKLNNFYVFKLMDMEDNTTTGYYGMAVKKEVADNIVKKAEQVKQGQIDNVWKR